MRAVALAILALTALPPQDEEAAEARRRALQRPPEAGRGRRGRPPRDLERLRTVIPAGSWKSGIPCQIRQRRVLGPGGGHSYFYTAHRPDCPFLIDRLSPVCRGSFLCPYELRARDSAWAEQVRQNLRVQFWRSPR
jgi:hypothetical protein